MTPFNCIIPYITIIIIIITIIIITVMVVDQVCCHSGWEKCVFHLEKMMLKEEIQASVYSRMHELSMSHSTQFKADTLLPSSKNIMPQQPHRRGCLQTSFIYRPHEGIDHLKRPENHPNYQPTNQSVYQYLSVS